MKFKEVFNAAVVVAALGYFVDVYDLVLFLIVGKRSLLDIGVTPDALIDTFQYLLNVQMVGMLVGGVVWGVLGDKNGRLSVLFGSIITYSLANLLNGFVNNIEQYTLLRFIAGFGLAGELGAGVTLVSESMSKENRGYGTMVIASIGVTGAVVASLISNIGWQFSYIIGGVLGLSLLLLRIGVIESGMFSHAKSKHTGSMGDFFLIFKNNKRMLKYFYCICIGLPVWYIIGILVGLAPTFAKFLGIQGTVEDSMAVMLCYSGLVLGDLFSGFLSQYMRSRKRIFTIFYLSCIVFIALYLNLYGFSATSFYMIIFFLGVSVGFWAIFVTVASEQFGTNLRATVTTSVPNFVRGSLVLIVMLFNLFLKTLDFNLIVSAMLTGVVVFSVAFIALSQLGETFGKNLDYFEVS